MLRHSRPVASIETLERRAYFTAVSGIVFDDYNANGIKDPGEPAPLVARAYIDLNNDSTYSSGEPWDHTDSSGLFLISGLTTGQTYTVRVSSGPSEVPTVPAVGGGYTFVAPALGQIASGYFFGTYSTWQDVRIDGSVYDDVNGNGTYDAFEWAEGHTVWLDKDDDGKIDPGEPTDGTDVFGNFTFDDLFNPNVPTDYVVRIRPKAGYIVTSPTDGRYVFNAEPGEWMLEKNHFAVRQVGSISGSVMFDVNADGPETMDFPFRGKRVYADLNGNEVYDQGEPAALTGLGGGFLIEDLVAGTYTIRLDLAPDLFQTYGGTPTITLAAGQHYDQISFGVDSISSWAHVYQFRDANNNGVRDANEPLEPGKDVFWDLDQNGVYDGIPTDYPAFAAVINGVSTFRIDVPLGTQRFAIRPEGGKRVTTAAGYVTGVGTEVNGVFVVEVPYQSFATISGRTYNDNNANGVFDAGDSPIARVVFLDTNNNARRDAGERFLTSRSDGTFMFDDVVPGSYSVRREFPKGYKPSNPTRDYVLVGGESIIGADVGSVTSSTVVVPPGQTPPPPSDPKTASISGRTYNDNNANGIYDAGDALISGKTVFIDWNNNGKLDSGEKSTKSNASGMFSFTGLAAGTYYIRRVFPTGYTYSNAPINLTLGAGQAFSGAGIGSVPAGTVVTLPGDTPPPPPPTGDPKTASISGVLFWDSDRDGTFDTGESYQGGKTVFIDLDNDNILDSNERKLTTDSQGRFTFDGLVAGTYNVKRVLSKGYIATTPAQTISLGAGEIFSGVAIGTNTN